jgi:predicted nucleotidyltransferase component of viral defense system
LSQEQLAARAGTSRTTFDPEELAGRTLVALFSRAEARDLADVYALRSHSVSTARLSWHALTKSTRDSITSSSPT